MVIRVISNISQLLQNGSSMTLISMSILLRTGSIVLSPIINEVKARLLLFAPNIVNGSSMVDRFLELKPSTVYIPQLLDFSAAGNQQKCLYTRTHKLIYTHDTSNDISPSPLFWVVVPVK